MGIKIQYVAKCDRCGETTTHDERPKGWAKRADMEVCPPCVQAVDEAMRLALNNGKPYVGSLTGQNGNTVNVNGYAVELE